MLIDDCKVGKQDDFPFKISLVTIMINTNFIVCNLINILESLGVRQL